MDLRATPAYVEPCEIETTVHAAIDAVRPFALKRGSSIVVLRSQPARVAIESDRLVQTVINLLDNAIKHGREHGRAYVSVTQADARFMEVRVDDDGPGVPLEEREAIFSLARRGTNARGKGSGLGLAVARLLIERVGGTLDVVDSLLGGAQFRIRVPLHIDAAAEASELHEIAQPTSLAEFAESKRDDGVFVRKLSVASSPEDEVAPSAGHDFGPAAILTG